MYGAILIAKPGGVTRQSRTRRRLAKGIFIMTPNVGTTDRLVRLIIGAGLVGATLFGAIGPWGWIGLVPLATGALRYCPAYRLFGLSTCGSK